MKSFNARNRAKHTDGASPWTVNRRILASAAVAGLALGGMLAPGVAGAATSTNAKASVSVGGKTYKLSGGACLVTASRVALGIGTNANTLGMNANVKQGKFSNAQIGMVLGGKPLALTTDTGTASSKGGTFQGTDVVSGSTVKGKFSC
ncbi:MAG TPA: hypothetical protein VNV87_07670 [Acidimicrobiales bacterium]|jgi:hypothetical protein|nr:hypothetical protein [Acidimicrobiales bacterium]